MRRPGRPGTGIIANLTLDLTSPSVLDSIAIDGLQDVELSVSPGWVATTHPELGLRVTDGGTVARPRSDHFAFVRRAVPSLYIHAEPPDGAAASRVIDTSYVARVSRLLFYVGEEIANADQRPRWSTAGRQQLRTVLVP